MSVGKMSKHESLYLEVVISMSVDGLCCDIPLAEME